MKKEQIIVETIKAIKNYDPGRCKQTADMLRNLWLKSEVKKTAHLVKKEQREKLNFEGIGLDVLKPMGKEIGKVAKNRVDDFLLLAKLLWNEYGREGRIVSVMILGQMELSDPQKIIPICKELVKKSVSWEECDNMAMEGVEPIIRKEPEKYLKILDLWLRDENKWVRRVAITVIGRLPMKTPEYTARCLKMTVLCLEDDDLDIKRANSFAIRFGARGDKKAFINFIDKYAGGENYAKIWVFSDVIRSMTKKFLPEFKTLLPIYEKWLESIDDPKSQRCLESATKILKAVS